MHSIEKVGSPVLRVRDIDKIVTFYETKLGLQVKRRHQVDYDNAVYELGFVHIDYPEDSLLQLHHDPNAKMLLHIQPAFFILQYLFQTERVLLQPIWHLKIQECTMMDLLII